MTSVNLKKAVRPAEILFYKKSIHVVISFPVVFGLLGFGS